MAVAASSRMPHSLPRAGKPEELLHVDRGLNCIGRSNPRRRTTTHQAKPQRLPRCDSSAQSGLRCSRWIQDAAVFGTGSHWLPSKTKASCSVPTVGWLLPLRHRTSCSASLHGVTGTAMVHLERELQERRKGENKGEKDIPKYSAKIGLWLHEREEGMSLGSLSDVQE